MDTSSIIISVVLLSLAIVPVLYIIFIGSNKGKQMTKKVKKLAQDQGVTVQSVEIIGNSILAIDTSLKKLILSDIRDPEKHFEIIALEQLKECRTKTLRLTNKTLDLVELELIGKNFIKQVVFYREDDEDSPVTDSQICYMEAQKWERTIQQHIKAA